MVMCIGWANREIDPPGQSKNRHSPSIYDFVRLSDGIYAFPLLLTQSDKDLRQSLRIGQKGGMAGL